MNKWMINAFRYSTLNDKSIPAKDVEFSNEMYYILMQKQKAYRDATEDIQNY